MTAAYSSVYATMVMSQIAQVGFWRLPKYESNEYAMKHLKSVLVDYTLGAKNANKSINENWEDLEQHIL